MHLCSRTWNMLVDPLWIRINTSPSLLALRIAVYDVAVYDWACFRHVQDVRPNKAANFRGTTICKLQGGSRFDLSLDWLSVCHSLQCWPKNQKWMQPDVFCKHTMQQNATVAGNTPRRKRGEGERRLTPMCSWNREQGHWQTKAGPGVWQRQVLLNDHQTTTVAVTHNAKTRAVDIND